MADLTTADFRRTGSWVGLLRVLLGAILLADAAMEWRSATYATYPSQIYSNASVSPWPLEPLLVFWAELWGREPVLAGALLAAVVTMLGLLILVGLYSRVALLLTLPLLLGIWVVGQGVGLPFAPGATDLGSGIAYLLCVLLLLALRSWRAVSLDRWRRNHPGRERLVAAGATAAAVLAAAAVVLSLALVRG